jgi:hypothetical protein
MNASRREIEVLEIVEIVAIEEVLDQEVAPSWTEETIEETDSWTEAMEVLPGSMTGEGKGQNHFHIS